MYLMITTRCNMTCEHCCSSCTAIGEDMRMEVFEAALQHCSESISIGGGEPTIHPQFIEMLFKALGHRYIDYVWLATNGKETELAIVLAKLARRGVLGVALSQDPFHDPIDDAVVDAFTDGMTYKYGRLMSDHDGDSREIRDTSSSLVKIGRCETGDADKCVCDSLVVKPNGDVYECGCDEATCLGNVLDGDNFLIPEWYGYECVKERLNREQLEKAG